MPLNGRSFQSLIALTPGVVVTPTNGGSEAGQFSVAGQRAGSNYFQVDGVSANFAAATGIFEQQTTNGGIPALSALGSTNSLVSVDALQEFRIESSTYAPEFGRESGGQIVLVTRSGTNQFHGTAYDYLRNDVLDANDWFAASLGLPKPRERQNDFGGVLGGPIVRDKTFFFVSYEGLRVVQPNVQISDVPSMEARQNAPASFQAILNAFPIPNGPSTGPGISQYAASLSSPSNLDAVSLRIDHAINSKLTLFGRFDYSPSEFKLHNVGKCGPVSSTCPITQTTDTGTIGLTAPINPRVTNEFRFNYSRAQAGDRFALGSFGGAVVPPDSAIAAPWQDLATGWMYLYDTVGRGVGFVDGLGADNINHQINATDSIAIAKGTHSLKFGFDFRQLTPFARHPATGADYVWLGTHSLALGQAPDQLVIYEAPNILRLRFHNFSVYGQDTWKPSSRLTLTYGLRWDYNPPPAVTSGNPPYVLSQITDLATATLLPRGTPLWHADWKNFAPRFGASYLLNPSAKRSTVLRFGVGQFFDIGTSTAGALDNGQGYFPYSLVVKVCGLGTTVACGNTIPYTGPEPPFVFTQPYAGVMRGFDPHLKLPYSLQWDASVEQALSVNQTFKMTYLGSVGRRLLRDDVISNPNPTLTSLFLATNKAYSSYNALQLQYQRRLSHGLQALVSYSWSHSLDLNSGDASSPWGGASVGIPSNLYNIKQEYGDSDFDIRHTFSAAVTYDFPTNHLSNPFVSGLLRNWSIDSINSARSGAPFNVAYQPLNPGAFTSPQGGTFLIRPDRVPGQPLYINDQKAPGGKRLNLAAFSIPSVVGQGTEGRNTIRGFPLLEMDVALRRQFNLTERMKLQFRAEGFNVINHPNFANPLNNLGTCAQGVPCTPVYGWGTSQTMLNQSMAGDVYTNGFGTLYQVGGPRSLQLAIKLQF
jgi:hypothetical protein